MQGSWSTSLEQNEAAAAAGAQRVEALYAARVKRGRLSEEAKAERLSRIKASGDWSSIAAADMAIEAAFEDMAVKHAIFGRLDALARPGAILATNTSYLGRRRHRMRHQAAQRRGGTSFFLSGACHAITGGSSGGSDCAGRLGNGAGSGTPYWQASGRGAEQRRFYRQPYLRRLPSPGRIPAGRRRFTGRDRQRPGAIRLCNGAVRRVGHVRSGHRLGYAQAAGRNAQPRRAICRYSRPAV